METVNKKVILITLILTIVTSLLIYVYITKATEKPVEVTEKTVDIYVAARTLPPKYKIIENDIKLVKIRQSDSNTRAITKKEDIIGKRVKESIIEGEPIIQDRLIDEKKVTLSANIAEGKRAISINVQENMAVSNLIRPGDFVDIVASFEKEEIESATQKTVFPRITKTIIQNIEVLSLGQDLVVTDEKIKDAPKTVTFSVTPQEAEKLLYASEYAVLNMMLRRTDDNTIIDTKGVNREDVATGKGVYTVTK